MVDLITPISPVLIREFRFSDSQCVLGIEPNEHPVVSFHSPQAHARGFRFGISDPFRWGAAKRTFLVLENYTNGLMEALWTNKGLSFRQKIRRTSDKKYVVNDGVVEESRKHYM